MSILTVVGLVLVLLVIAPAVEIAALDDDKYERIRTSIAWFIAGILLSLLVVVFAIWVESL